MRGAWDAAASAPGALVHECLLLAGLRVDLLTAGRALGEAVRRPLAHLVTPAPGDGAAALTIRLWDEAATGVARPFSLLAGVLGEAQPFGRGAVTVSRDERFLGVQTVGMAAVLDREAGTITGWVASPGALSLYERGKPLQPLLFAWYADRDVLPVHAALVARGGRGVLLGGAGGSGKTTAALACLDAGWAFLGDDYVGLPPIEGTSPVGHSVYSSAWLDSAHASRFPSLAADLERSDRPDEEKWLVLLDRHAGAAFAPSASLAAIVLPRVVPGLLPRLVPARAADAVRRLAPSSLLQLPFLPARRCLERIAEVAEALPAFTLDVAGPPAGLPPFLARAAEGGGRT